MSKTLLSQAQLGEEGLHLSMRFESKFAKVVSEVLVNRKGEHYGLLVIDCWIVKPRILLTYVESPLVKVAIKGRLILTDDRPVLFFTTNVVNKRSECVC